MNSLLAIVSGVFGYIIIGYVLGKTNFIQAKIIKIFNQISFNLLLPIALIVNFWLIKFPEIIVYKLLIAFFGAGILVFIIGFFFSKKYYKFNIDDCALFGLAACFGNSVAFGIPLMYSILDSINVMPYMILVLFHGIVHFTYTTLIIESYRNRQQINFKKIINIILGLAQNVVLFAMFFGFFLNYNDITFPENLQKILLPISNIALPCVLISLGLALSKIKVLNDLNYSIILTCLKNFLHPLFAFILAKYILQMSPILIFIVTIAAALPSGSQTFYFSYRYNSLQNIISANVVLSTFISFITISLLLIFFGY